MHYLFMSLEPYLGVLIKHSSNIHTLDQSWNSANFLLLEPWSGVSHLGSSYGCSIRNGGLITFFSARTMVVLFLLFPFLHIEKLHAPAFKLTCMSTSWQHLNSQKTSNSMPLWRHPCFMYRYSFLRIVAICPNFGTDWSPVLVERQCNYPDQNSGVPCLIGTWQNHKVPHVNNVVPSSYQWKSYRQR